MDKDKINKLYVVSDLFSDGPQQAPDKIAISQTGMYTPAFGDPRDITEEMLEKMVENFEKDVLKTKPSVYYSHWDSKRAAAGEIKEVYTSYNETLSKTVLYARVEWTPQGKKAIMEKEYKYISAEFAYDFKRPVNKEGSYQSYGPVLTGVALTNEPAVYDIPQIVFSSNFSGNKDFLAQFKNLGSNKNIDDSKEGDLKMNELLKLMGVKNEKEALEKFSSLNETVEKLQKADFSSKLKDKDKTINELKKEIETIKEENFSAEKKTFLEGVFKEGKITKEKFDKAMEYGKDQFSVFKDIVGDMKEVLPKPKGSAAMKGANEKPDQTFEEYADKFDIKDINKGVE